MEIVSKPLPQQTVKSIQAWLNTPEASEFRKVLTAHLELEEAEAMKCLRESTGDDGIRGEALQHMEVAHKYRFTLDVFDSAARGHAVDKPEAKFPYVTVEFSDGQTNATQKLLEG